MTASIDATEDVTPNFDSAEFRRVLGTFCTGLTVVTSISEAGEPLGYTCQSFTSVSLEPPLVAFCPSASSTTWPRIRATGRFCVNVLAGEQRDIALKFAASGGPKFDDVNWRPGPDGLPLIDQALAWIVGTVESETVAGDHTIVVGRVHRLDGVREAEPLVFYRGDIGRYVPA